MLRFYISGDTVEAEALDISIHPMLRFYREVLSMKEILCGDFNTSNVTVLYNLLRLLPGSYTYFNTSNVTVLFIDAATIAAALFNFNTSNVTVLSNV